MRSHQIRKKTKNMEPSNSFEWYYIGKYGPLGPLSESQMIELAESGVIEKETLVWKAGMPDWTRAENVPELQRFLRFPQIPPPVPPDPPSHSKTSRHTSPFPAYLQSPCSRLLAGVLQVLPGFGRIYLGYLAIGTLQLLMALCTCGVLSIWSWIDGIVILLGGVRYDGYGRILR
jgi:hypothetical protein